MNLRKYTLTMAGLAAMSMSLSAATITYNFSENGTGDIGTTSSFASAPPTGPSLVASGFSSNTHTAQLYSKNAGGDENGLGLDLGYFDPDNEIQGNGFIQIDVAPLLAMYGNLTFQMNSSTGDDTWVVYATNTASTLSGASLVGDGTNESSHTFTTSKTYLDFTASSGNVLLRDITATATVPEPGTMSLLCGGFAMLGLGLIRRKKQVKQA